MIESKKFLPMTKGEMEARGWRELDVLLVTGDAYFDHPSHGTALIGRLLEKNGYRVGIVAQPDWRSALDFKKLGTPTLFVGISGGAVDSIVNNYTASGAKRRTDSYSSDGKSGHRPDNATLVYAARAREAFPGVPVVLGGVEASVRRFAYFDSHKSKVRRSLLIDSRSDLLVYGSGEYQVLEVAGRIGRGENLDGIAGTARIIRDVSSIEKDAVALPDYESVLNEPKELLKQTLAVESSGRPFFSKQMWQKYEEGIVLAQPPPNNPQGTFDNYFDLSFACAGHPIYREPISALNTVRWSVISHRGCPGGCSFCGLAMHQGRRILPRSEESILEEVARLASNNDFKGTITDIGGPTANAYDAKSNSGKACAKCNRPSCLFPKICRHLNTSHEKLLHLLEKASGLPNVKRVLLASGIRHDLAMKDPSFVRELARHYTGGHLKAAPEHVSPQVLKLMRKPTIEIFEEFERAFKKESQAADKKQYIVPYIIAAFPGCTKARANAAAQWLSRRGQTLEQVQIFMPLAGTVASAMFHAGTDQNDEPLFVADSKEQKRQKDLLTGKSHQPPQKTRKSKKKR